MKFGRNLIAAVALSAVLLVPTGGRAAAATCTPTGFYRDNINMTARLVNPTGTVGGTIDAAGCNIGVFYGDGGGGTVSGATISGANYFGVVAYGDLNDVSVDVLNSTITNVGESPLNGSQHGVAVYYRAFRAATATGTISGNTISHYQKGGIVTNGPGTTAVISANTVSGEGPVSYIAQNGIQVGYGANASVMRNTVTGHSYTGTSAVSGGIIVVGGPCYGGAYTVNTRIVGNTVRDNDVGIFLTNLGDDCGAPPVSTNVKAVNNTISNKALTNNYGGFGYQAGVSDVGNNDKIIANAISGAGYDPSVNPSAYTVFIDADPSFTNRPKVHANR